eukprot:g15986.t1
MFRSHGQGGRDGVYAHWRKEEALGRCREDKRIYVVLRRVCHRPPPVGRRAENTAAPQFLVADRRAAVDLSLGQDRLQSYVPSAPGRCHALDIRRSTRRWSILDFSEVLETVPRFGTNCSSCSFELHDLWQRSPRHVVARCSEREYIAFHCVCRRDQVLALQRGWRSLGEHALSVASEAQLLEALERWSERACQGTAQLAGRWPSSLLAVQSWACAQATDRLSPSYEGDESLSSTSRQALHIGGAARREFRFLAEDVQERRFGRTSGLRRCIALALLVGTWRSCLPDFAVAPVTMRREAAGTQHRVDAGVHSGGAPEMNITLEESTGDPDDILPGTTHGLPYVTCFVEYTDRSQRDEYGTVKARDVLEEWVMRGDDHTVGSFTSWRQSKASTASLQCVQTSSSSLDDTTCIECVSSANAFAMSDVPGGIVGTVHESAVMTFDGLGLHSCLSSTFGRPGQ